MREPAVVPDATARPELWWKPDNFHAVVLRFICINLSWLTTFLGPFVALGALNAGTPSSLTVFTTTVQLWIGSSVIWLLIDVRAALRPTR